MADMVPVRKGDMVAIERTHTMHFVNASRSDSNKEWTLATVSSATRDGIVKSVTLTGVTYSQKLEHMSGRPRVHTLSKPEYQEAARAIVAAAEPSLCWSSAEELRAAILAKVA